MALLGKAVSQKQVGKAANGGRRENGKTSEEAGLQAELH